MSPPDLEQLLAAARDDVPADGHDVRATRSRVLESLEQRGQRRQRLLALLTVLGLSAVGTTSWAWVSGWLPARIDELRGGDGAPPSPRRERQAGPRSRSAPAIEPALAVAGADDELAAEGAAIAPPPPAAQRAPAPTGAPKLAPAGHAGARPPGPVSRDGAGPSFAPSARRATPLDEAAPTALASAPPSAAAPDGAAPTARAPRAAEPAAPTSPASPAPARAIAAEPPTLPRDGELWAFRAAYQAQTGGVAATDALAAWERYLAAYPGGRLAPEARWNRAVLLVRLGRDAQAKAALTPFAEGAEGGYRQSEAARLLRGLDAATPTR